MTQDDITRMAQDGGLYSGHPRTPSTGRMIEKRLERFAALVAAAEREACAKVCEKERKYLLWRESQTLPRGEPRLIHMAGTAQKIEDAIRARGEK